MVTNAEQCFDGPMSALLWPMFVASCVAVTEGDRELALNAFGGTERRQKMNNIGRAWEVVREVWRRADKGEEGVDWRGVERSMGWSVIFG